MLESPIYILSRSDFRQYCRSAEHMLGGFACNINVTQTYAIFIAIRFIGLAVRLPAAIQKKRPRVGARLSCL